MSKAAPCPSRSATASIPSTSRSAWAARSSASGSPPSTSAKTWPPAKTSWRAARHLPQAAQHLPLPARQSSRLRSRDAMHGRRELLPLDRYMLARTRELTEKILGWYDGIRIPPRLSRGQRVRHRRPQLVLSRRSERPHVHLRAQRPRRAAPRRPSSGRSPKP